MEVTTLAPDRAIPTAHQLIVVEATCAPFAEADDLLELQPGGFDGDGVYALEYARPSGCNWSGLRRVRTHCGRLQIEEGTGWASVTDAARFIGKVCGVHKPRPCNLFTLEIA